MVARSLDQCCVRLSPNPVRIEIAGWSHFFHNNWKNILLMLVKLS